MKKRQTLKMAVILLLLAGGLVSCTDKEKEESCMPFIHIADGDLTGNEGIPQQKIVITTQEEWKSLKTEMSKERTKDFCETEVDFGKYLIIAVFDEIRNSGGWRIEVTCVAEHPDKIVVTVKAHYLGWLIAPEIITQPYHIVKIPRWAEVSPPSVYENRFNLFNQKQ
jgi:hypothetical protein